MLNARNVKIIGIFATIAIFAAWVTILLSMILNPWFRITSGALSDLGGGNLILNGHPSPTDPWVYNYGLILTGIFIAAFAAFSSKAVDNKIENAGLSFFIISGLFLALIGIYHEGTYPHDFVSIWFFVLSSISFFTIGISLVFHFRKYGVFMILFLISAWNVYSLIHWQSTAEDEIFGILVIDIVVLSYFMSLRDRLAAGGKNRKVGLKENG